MIVVDASIWVSRFITRDVFHASSEGWLMTQLSHGEWLVSPTLLLAELSGAISRRSGQAADGERAVQGMLRLPELRFVSLNRELALESARLAAQLGMRSADAVYAALAYRLKAPLYTWDEEQIQKGGQLITVKKPTL